MKKQMPNKSNLNIWQGINAKVYGFCIFFLAVFYLKDGYFDTTTAKMHMIVLVSLLYIIICGIPVAISGIAKCIKKEYDCKEIIKQMTFLDWSVLGFGVIVLFSTLFSKYKWQAVFGNSGFDVGTVILLPIIICYFVFSRSFSHTIEISSNKKKPEINILWWFFIGSATLECLLCALNGIGVDPFHLIEQLNDRQKNGYIGTIGNLTFFAGYIDMLLPFLIVIDGTIKTKGERIWQRITLYLAWLSLLLCKSDGAIIGVLFAMAFLVYFSIERKEFVVALESAIWTFVGAAVTVDILRMIIPRISDMMDHVVRILICQHVYFLIIVLGVGVSYYLKKNQEMIPQSFVPKIKKVYLGLVAIVFLIGCVLIIKDFDFKWGTYRGFDWWVGIQLFKNASLKDKIIGVGPDCFGIIAMEQYGEIIGNVLKMRLANAHNEFIQYLVTTGILGFLSYLGIWIGVFIEMKNSKQCSCEKMAVFLGVIGYLGQAWVENPVPLNIAILILLLASYRQLE